MIFEHENISPIEFVCKKNNCCNEACDLKFIEFVKGHEKTQALMEDAQGNRKIINWTVMIAYRTK